MRATRIILLGCVGILFGACQPAPVANVATVPVAPANRGGASPVAEPTYLVARVIDGDTIELEGGERVRLICIDTPERGKPGYAEAKTFLRDLIEGKRVTMAREVGHADRDRFGRLLRLVWIGETLVQHAIIDAGHSVYVTKWGASPTIENPRPR